MEEVRSYWQVASISHFCTIFGKPFRLPTFEPEELEQAFILDIPAPVVTSNNNINSTNNNLDHIQEEEKEEENTVNNKDDDEWVAPAELIRDPEYQALLKQQKELQQQTQQDQQEQQPAEEQQELHLLVRLAIALLRPHFNCKISHANWENYLRRIIDSNWVELEHHPSPFRVPLISQDGVELTKNLTFNELPLSDKIDLFYALCDYRLWCEDAAEAIKDYPLEELRLESVGKDSQGYEYWFFSGTRLFRENKELSQDIILRKKRIKELEYKLIELDKTRIFREQEERRKAELEKAKQLASEAREARLAAKKQQEQGSNRKKKQTTPILPPRTGLRERRTSTTSNNNDSQQSRTPITRSRQGKQPQSEQPQQQSGQKTTRGVAKNSKHNDNRQDKIETPDLPKKSPEEECKDELERLKINPEDRAEAWRVECESLEDWESFATKFEKTKSTNEKYLSAYINQEILPKIRAIYAKRAADARRKEKELLISLTSRRVSTRIISKRAQEEEEERKAQLREAEMRLKKIEAEARLRAELEREMKLRKNRLPINGTTSSTCSEDGEDCNGRYNLRQQQHHQAPGECEFEGIIHPDELAEFYEALELVIDTVRTSKHAWPFVDPVPETVPGYYDLITEPMDLRKLRTKIEFREYKSLIELEKDFQLLVNNCEKFNGPRNVYTKMVYKLWKSFRKNVRLYLQRDLSMDEYETFLYPPQPKLEPPEPPEMMMDHESEVKHSEQITVIEEEMPPATIEPNHELEHKIPPPSYVPLSEQRYSPTPPPTYPQHGLTEPLKPLEHFDNSEIIMKLNNHCGVESSAISKSPEESPEPKAPTPELITGEEIIIDSYDVPCPDDNFFICS